MDGGEQGYSKLQGEGVEREGSAFVAARPSADNTVGAQHSAPPPLISLSRSPPPSAACCLLLLAACIGPAVGLSAAGCLVLFSLALALHPPLCPSPPCPPPAPLLSSLPLRQHTPHTAYCQLAVGSSCHWPVLLPRVSSPAISSRLASSRDRRSSVLPCISENTPPPSFFGAGTGRARRARSRAGRSLFLCC